MLVKLLEKFGIFLFINSILIISQIRWAKEHHYNDFDLRITFCFVLSIIVYYGIMKALLVKNVNTDNISFALSFFILAITLNSNTEIIILIFAIVSIYFIKKYKANSIFENFWGYEEISVKYKKSEANLKITQNSNNELNIFKFKYLFTELINCIIYCKDNKLTKLTLEGSETKKLNDIIIIIFNYFDINIEVLDDKINSK